MKKTFFLKTFWKFLFIIILVTSLILLYSINSIKKFNEHLLSDQLYKISLALRPSIVNLISQQDDQIDDFVKKMGKSLGVRITVVAPKGKVLADSHANPESMENHRDRPVIKKALLGVKSKESQFSFSLRSKMLYLAIPIIQKDSIIGALRVSMFFQNINQFNRKIKNHFIFMALVLLFLSMIIVFVISKKISLPIRKMIDASRKVSQGDYTKKVFSKDKGEVGELIQSFNQMVEHQQKLFNKISANHVELQTIIGSIKEGLLVIDKDGTILKTNESFNQMIGNKNTEQKKYWEVCRNTDFYQHIQKVLADMKSFNGQVELNGKIYITSFNFLPNQNRIVITFHDISEIKQLETMKKDFIINVSHELKTPLTSIKGFLEILEEESNESSQKYLSIIKRNTDRLIHMVQDLLLLSRVEDKNFISDKNEIHMKQLLNSVVILLEPRIKRKKLNFVLDVQDNLPLIKGDPSKLEDMFINVLDNAIKYTEKGSITIRIKQENNWIRSDIIDTGIGIPENHLDRIFERFFVLDPSRSKETGGTGLGLSIVKHIVLLHNGTIHVESVLNQGTSFVIRLPII